MYPPAKTHRRTANNRYLLLGCHSKRQGSSRILGQCNRKQALKSSGDVGCSHGIGSIQGPCNWENYSSGVRQHFNHSLLEPYGRTKPRIESDSKCNMDRGYKQSRIHYRYLLSHSRKKQYSIRSPKSPERQVQVATPPRIIQLLGRNVGSSHHRSICISHNSSNRSLQYSVLSS